MHNGLLQLGADKMSKSLGNLVSVEEALAAHHPDTLRVYFLSSHYRSPLNYSSEGAEATERSLERLRYALRPTNPLQSPFANGETGGFGEPFDATPLKQRFLAAMDTDLNTPQAVAVLFDLAREINRARDSGGNVAAAQDILRDLGTILGLTFHDSTADRQGDLAARPFIELLVSTREELRRAKQYELADQIRHNLASHGITLEDTPQGTEWQHQPLDR
jgi:cysteinyl-tRNA synthetase